jgi:YD repeat-containing protein
MKLLLSLLAVAALTSQAHAQARTFYDQSGKVVGRSVTDSQGSTTVYDASGRTAGRSSTDSQGTTTYRDAGGRKIGQTTKGTVGGTPGR